MAHVKRGVTGKARHRKITKMAKGYRGRAKNCFRVAVEKVEKGLRYSYRDRRLKKRNYRSLWIQRINAGAREHGLTYSQLIGGLNKAGVTLDRKALSEIAIHDAPAFASLAKQAKDAMQKAAA